MRRFLILLTLGALVRPLTAQVSCTLVRDTMHESERLSGCRLDGMSSLLLAGDTLWVGNADRDVVYRFGFDGADWTLRDSLRPPDVDAGDRFGENMVRFGRRLLISAPEGDGDSLPASGVAYVYRHDAPGFALEGKLVPAQEQAGADFGASMAMGRVPGGSPGAAIGMPLFDGDGISRSGAVALFRWTPAGWKPSAIMTEPGAKTNGYFGFGVSLDGPWLAVGTPNGGVLDADETRVYRDSLGHFVERDRLGLTAVAMKGGELFGLRRSWDVHDPPLLRAYRLEDDAWSVRSVVPFKPYRGHLHDDGWFSGAGDFSWSAVDLDGERAVIGSPNTPTDKNAKSGIVTVYERGRHPNGIPEWRMTDLVVPEYWHADLDYAETTHPGLRLFGVDLSLDGDRLAVHGVDDSLGQSIYLYDLSDRCRAPFRHETRMEFVPDSFAFRAAWQAMPGATGYRFGLLYGLQDDRHRDWTLSDTSILLRSDTLPERHRYTWRVQTICGARASDYRRVWRDFPERCGPVDETWLDNLPGASLRLSWRHAPLLSGDWGDIRVRTETAVFPVTTIEEQVLDPSMDSSALVPRPPAGKTYRYRVDRLCRPPFGTGYDASPILFTNTMAPAPPPIDPVPLRQGLPGGWRLFAIDGRLLDAGNGPWTGEGLSPGAYVLREGGRGRLVFVP